MLKNELRKKLSVVLFGATAALLILEVGVRFFTPEDFRASVRTYLGERLRDCQKKDKVLNHKLTPNCSGRIVTNEYNISFKTNSLGLRNEEVDIEKKNAFRVLLVGDSFTEGWGVERENRFDKVAQKRIKELLKEEDSYFEIEIVNAGIRSYSPVLELIYLKEFGLRLNPDLVIMLYDFSDLHDDFYYGGWPLHYKLKESIGLFDKKYLPEWPEDKGSRILKLVKKSRLFSIIFGELKHAVGNKNHKITLENLTNDISLFSKGQNWEDYEKAWNLSLNNIMLTRDFLKEKGIDFALVVIPRGNYVNPDEWREGRFLLGIQGGVLYNSLPIDIIENEAKNQGIEVINILNPLKESEIFPLYYPIDGHWTVDGNSVVGEIFAEYIFKVMH